MPKKAINTYFIGSTAIVLFNLCAWCQITVKIQLYFNLWYSWRWCAAGATYIDDDDIIPRTDSNGAVTSCMSVASSLEGVHSVWQCLVSEHYQFALDVVVKVTAITHRWQIVQLLFVLIKNETAWRANYKILTCQIVEISNNTIRWQNGHIKKYSTWPSKRIG